MPKITVTGLSFTDDAGSRRLDTPNGWQQVAIGVNSAINLTAEAAGAAFDLMPDTLPVDLTSRGPNRVGGTATLSRHSQSLTESTCIAQNSQVNGYQLCFSDGPLSAGALPLRLSILRRATSA